MSTRTLIVATVLLTGCAGVMPNGIVPRQEADLTHFIVDCNNKQAQVEYLQSLRPGLYQKQVKQAMAGGERSGYEWMIDYHLQQLSYCDNNRKYPKAPTRDY